MASETVEDLTTYIAPGTLIKGEITFTGPVRICGRVEGIIRAEDLLEIAEEAVIQGDIHGTFIDVQGTIKGNITASKSCRLNASARINGELHAANLAIAEGAVFVGKVAVGGDAGEEHAPAPAEPVRMAVQAPVHAPTHAPAHYAAVAPAAVHIEAPTPVTVLQNRLEQMAVEAEQVAVAAHMGAPMNGSAQSPGEPQVRVNQSTIQSTLNRPRIIKASR